VDRWSVLAAGDDFTCGLSDEGEAFCWGEDRAGALGNGSQERGEGSSATPVRVAGSRSFDSLTVGAGHACALDGNGRAWCWGDDGAGRLGVSGPQVRCEEADGTRPCRSEPVRAAAALRFRTLSAGGAHTCGITVEEELFCWGSNVEGQLGIGSTGGTTSTPVRVGAGFATVSAGTRHTCAVTSDGRLFCFGDNTFAQLGDGTRVTRTTPFPVILRDASFAAAGNQHTCAGAPARCWGENGDGQLGDGTRFLAETPVTVESDTTLVSLATGRLHTCAVDARNRALCWGNGAEGQLGLGEIPGDVLRPRRVAGEETYRRVTAGDDHTCGVTGEGRALCWGANRFGQLGDGTRESRAVPTPVDGG